MSDISFSMTMISPKEIGFVCAFCSPLPVITLFITHNTDFNRTNDNK